MSSIEEVIILTRLEGTPQVLRNAGLISGAMTEMGAATKAASLETEAATKRGFLAQQGFFTMRRIMFGTTLAIVGLGAAAIKMGYDFDKTMQVARVSMTGFLPSVGAVNRELRYLYNFAAYTPFQFQDIVLATRRILPFAGNLKTANMAVHAIVESLAGMGVYGAAALTRASLAMSHLLAGTTVTGQLVTQLRRDNVPLLLALAKYYGVTTERIQEMVHQGLIPAGIAVKALNQYVNTTPGFMNAAMKVATRTLSGAATTFKDIIMQSFGGAEGGIFSAFQHMLRGVDVALATRLATGQNISITNLAEAFDKTLTPSTHLLIDAFSLLQGVIDGLKISFTTVATIFAGAAYVLGLFAGSGNDSRWAMHYLGIALGIVIAGFLIYKGVLFGVTVVQGILTALDYGWITLIFIKYTIQGLYNERLYYQLALTKAQLIWSKLQIIADYAWVAVLWLLAAAQFILNKSFWAQLTMTKAQVIWTKLLVVADYAWIAVLYAVSAAQWVLNAAMDANPIGLIIIAVAALIAGLILLYTHWDWFHKQVDKLWSFIMTNAPYVAAALVIAFGPIGVALAGIILIVKYLNEIKAAWGWFTGLFGGGGAAQNPQQIATGRGLSLPGSTYTPSTPNYPMMGVPLNQGGIKVQKATHAHSDVSPIFNNNESWMGGKRQPIQIQLHVGKRALANVLTEIQTDQMARA